MPDNLLLATSEGRNIGKEDNLRKFVIVARQMIVYRGEGLAVMINANENSGMISRIAGFIARKYDWPGWQSQ